MIKAKKGQQIFTVFLSIFFATALLYLALDASYLKMKKYPRLLGESQLNLLKTYEKGEMVLFFIDESARLALRQVFQDINNNGLKTQCGATEDGYALLNTESQTCYPDIKQYVKEQFNKNLEEFFLLYEEPIPEMDYDYYIKHENENLNFIAKSKKSLRMDVGNIKTYNFMLDELNIGGEETTETSADAKNNEIDSAASGAVSAECSYCYYKGYKDYWQNLVKNWDSSSSCDNKCCKAKCPPGTKLLDVPYTNQCEIKYGSHPDALPSSYGWGNLDACLAMCGPTSVQMLNDYYKGGYDLRGVKCDWSKVKLSCRHWYDGAYRAKMPGVLKEETGKTFEIKGLSLSAIKSSIDQGKPVITGLYIPGGCPLTSKYTYYCWDGMGHIFVVVGYAPGYIILNDPYTDYLGRNKEWSHNIVLPEQAFMKIWSGDSVFLT